MTGSSCFVIFGDGPFSPEELVCLFGIAPVSLKEVGAAMGEYGRIVSRALKDTVLLLLIGEGFLSTSFIGVDVLTSPFWIGLCLISSFSTLSIIGSSLRCASARAALLVTTGSVLKLV